MNTLHPPLNLQKQSLQVREHTMTVSRKEKEVFAMMFVVVLKLSDCSHSSLPTSTIAVLMFAMH